MTVNSPVTTTPLLIQSSKLIEWLLNRKLLQKDYPKRLAVLEDLVTKQIESLPSSVIYPFDSPSTFLACSKTYEAIQKADTQTDFFGRASYSVRSWRDIVDGFKKQNVYVAELSEALQELASISIPKCKGIIADEQKRITDLRQRIKEYTLNASKQEDNVEKAFREFGIELNEARIKLRLLEKAAQVFPLLEEIVKNLKDLSPAVGLYETMTCYVRSVTRSMNKEKPDQSQCCRTLKLLIESGHVRLYTWITGRVTEQWGPDDDWIPNMLEQESALHRTEDAFQCPDVTQSLDAEGVGIDFGEIDFGSIEAEISDDIPVEIDLTMEVVDGEGDKSGDGLAASQINPGVTSPPSTDIPSGKNTRLLLDTMEGRTALLNDLVELSAFLGRFAEDLAECQDAEEATTRTNTAQGGSIALQQMIMQNAPAQLQSVSSKEVLSMLSRVHSLRDQLTNSSLSQLLMIRSKPGFLDRLVARLNDLRSQVERSKRRVAEAQLQIDEAIVEQEKQAAVLIKHRTDCALLLRLLEEHISQLCNRPVQVIGHVLNM